MIYSTCTYAGLIIMESFLLSFLAAITGSEEVTWEVLGCLVVTERHAMVKFKGGCLKDLKNQKGKVTRKGMNYLVQVKATRKVMNHHFLDLKFLQQVVGVTFLFQGLIDYLWMMDFQEPLDLL